MPPRPIPPPETPPPLRVLDWPLPPYRYVPGLNAHPFRSPAGHLYTDGRPPPDSPWDPHKPWREDRRYLRALDLFDQRFPWEAHEAWEALWHHAPRGEPLAELLQGLIQVSAGLLKRHMGQERPAARLVEVGAARLRRVEQARGAGWRGVWVGPLLAAASAFDGGAAWPVLSTEELR